MKAKILGLLATLLLVVALILPQAALAATATPDYTCGSYGGNSYGDCDTVVNPGGGTTTPTKPTTPTTPAPTTPTTPTPTPTTPTTPTNPTSGTGQTTGNVPVKHSRKLWLFILFFLIFLSGLLLFLFLLFKRRKRKDDQMTPPTTPLPPTIEPTQYQ